MEKTGVQRLASVLKVLVTLTFICNLAALPVVPVLVMIGREGLGLLGLFSSDPGLGGFLLLARAGEMNEYGYVLSVFLVFCGGCTAVILWQGRRVLNTILAQRPQSAQGGGMLLPDCGGGAGPDGVGLRLLRLSQAAVHL